MHARTHAGMHMREKMATRTSMGDHEPHAQIGMVEDGQMATVRREMEGTGTRGGVYYAYT